MRISRSWSPSTPVIVDAALCSPPGWKSRSRRVNIRKSPARLTTRHSRTQIIRSQLLYGVPVLSFPFPLQMATNVRARRPPSPPPQQIYTPPPTQPRFPHPKHEHLDADERRTQASKPYFAGRRTNPGGLNVTSAEWKLLILVVIVACIVRLFRISQPNSVV